MSKKGPSEKYLPDQDRLFSLTIGTLLESLAKHIQTTRSPLPQDLKEEGLITFAYLQTPSELRTTWDNFKKSWNRYKEIESNKHRQAEIAVRLMGTEDLSTLEPPPYEDISNEFDSSDEEIGYITDTEYSPPTPRKS